ncbi:MAG: hypothetical protein ACK5P5_14645 [Pseudobdellovibrionaceae bacterium]
MIETFSSLNDSSLYKPLTGCFIDTTILFSATYPLDSFNDECEFVFDFLAENQVQIFTNINVRAEFIENHRRALIADCLIDLLEDEGANYDGVLLEKLKSHRTSFRRKVSEEKSAKMDVNQIKTFRRLLAGLHKNSSGDGWDLFCKKYLLNKIEPLWDAAQEIYQLNFISIRSDDEHPHLNSIPQWKNAEKLVGRYGIASSDAMILNMFLSSKIPVLLTADLEMAEVANKESNGIKKVFVPDSLFESTR